MTFKVGDKVIVRRPADGESGDDHPQIGWANNMDRFDGMPSEVEQVLTTYDPAVFRIRDGGGFLFADKWLEPVESVEPKPDLKIKTAAEKVPLDLIPLHALQGAARVFQHGAAKYEPGNFLLAQDDEAPRRYAGALLRHMCAAQDPNGLFKWETLAVLDDESGLPDLDHAIASLIMVRAAAIKKGALPADPGVSKLVKESK